MHELKGDDFTSAKINTLPESHVDYAWNTCPTAYQGMVRRLAKQANLTQREVHCAVLQSIYNAHLRVMDYLIEKKKKTELITKAALPLISPRGYVVATAVTATAVKSLKDTSEMAREALKVIQKEEKVREIGGHTHSAIYQQLTPQNEHNFISLQEDTVIEAVQQALLGIHPNYLVELIARETFLGYTKTHAHLEEYARRLKEAELVDFPKIEDRTGVKAFQKRYPGKAAKHFQEDFAPLLNLLKRR